MSNFAPLGMPAWAVPGFKDTLFKCLMSFSRSAYRPRGKGKVPRSHL
jgi:hypothetical protein